MAWPTRISALRSAALSAVQLGVTKKSCCERCAADVLLPLDATNAGSSSREMEVAALVPGKSRGRMGRGELARRGAACPRPPASQPAGTQRQPAPALTHGQPKLIQPLCKRIRSLDKLCLRGHRGACRGGGQRCAGRARRRVRAQHGVGDRLRARPHGVHQRGCQRRVLASEQHGRWRSGPPCAVVSWCSKRGSGQRRPAVATLCLGRHLHQGRPLWWLLHCTEAHLVGSGVQKAAL